MNKEEIKGEVGKEIVEDSCGCVWCDMDLTPTPMIAPNGFHMGDVHVTKRGNFPCTKQ